MAHRTIKAKNLRIGDYVIMYGHVTTMSQLWYSRVLCERGWDVYFGSTPNLIHKTLMDNDDVIVSR